MYPLKTKVKYDVNKLASTLNTYTTVYLGNYLTGDYSEGHGSHPGVDIIPILPNDVVFACLDGVVQVAQNKATEGNYVVIKHDNVPDPVNPTVQTTLYSCYLHLSELGVTVGQLVSEGDVIGKSGNTGNSTGEHLHFQIDRADAPFHPYWPFSFTEAKEAGMGFFEAVNKGLGIDKARQYTISPLTYLDQVASGDFSASANPTLSTTTVASTIPVIPTPQPTPVITPTPVPTPIKTTTSSSWGFTDVPANYPYAPAINSLKSQDIVSGNNGKFLPNNTITRAELLKMVFWAAGTTLVTGGQNYFSDVDAKSWQASYANTAKVNRVIGGYSDGTFKPNNPITRAEAFKIIINTFHTEALDSISFRVFDDVPTDMWYAPYANFAKIQHLIQFTANIFEPDKLMTRWEVANAIYILMQNP